MIKLTEVPTDLVTKAGAVATTLTAGSGWVAEVLSWNWSVISFIIAAVCAVVTTLWNAYYKHKTYKLQREALEKGLAFYEFTK